MDALTNILDGLEAALELERELGVKAVECPRELLQPPSHSPQVQPTPPKLVSPPKPVPSPKIASSTTRSASESAKQLAPAKVVFLYHKALDERESVMMNNIVKTLCFTSEEAPIVWEKPIPRATAYVVLGYLALKKFMPGRHADVGTWIRSEGGKDVLVTYSPAYILRFDEEVTPSVNHIKAAMWRSLKSMAKRVKAL